MGPRFAEATAHIFADRLIHNFHTLRACSRPGVRICAALKANAYGHGLEVVAPVLYRAGADCAAVAQLDEALALRRIGWSRPILVLGAVLSLHDAEERRDRLAAVIKHDFTLTLIDDGLLSEINAAASHAQHRVRLHLKIDTGMGRMGALPSTALDTLQALPQFPWLRLTGVYSHFGTADLADRELADHQLAQFRSFLDRAGDSLPAGILRHLANTAATLERPDTHFEMVRPGIGLYGYAPTDRVNQTVDLRPALRLTSRVSLIKPLPAGHCVGYGCTFRTSRPTRLGVVPVGYYEGYLRALSNRMIVGTAAGDAPVIGRVSMDQLGIDLTELPSVMTGDTITLIDEQPHRPNSVASIARALGTIPYEVVCLLGTRIQRLLA